MFRKPNARHPVLAKALSMSLLCLFLAFEGAAQTGSARDAFKGSTEFRTAVDDTASSIERYVGRLETIDRSLARLSRSEGGFAERYQSFANELRKLEKAQKSASSNVERMRARETDYFTAWDKANMQIADPELRQAAAARRSEAMMRYQALGDDLSAIGRGLQPLMSDLRDLDLFLGADRSRASLTEASEMIDRCRAEVRSLRNEVASVQRILKVFLETR